ncbi:hypothetical protein PHYSODRAFT_535902, partial [Phytophthora sojae]
PDFFSTVTASIDAVLLAIWFTFSRKASQAFCSMGFVTARSSPTICATLQTPWALGRAASSPSRTCRCRTSARCGSQK